VSISSELNFLSDSRGFINPNRVHDWARANPRSELHRSLEWDDARAGHEFRLGQIRRLIQIHVVDVAGDRRTISLVQDRHELGGYRYLAPVLSNAEMRRMALVEAFAEYKRWERRYKYFLEFKPLFDAAARVERDIEGDGDKEIPA
jgi:hypothetical protein